MLRCGRGWLNGPGWPWLPPLLCAQNSKPAWAEAGNTDPTSSSSGPSAYFSSGEWGALVSEALQVGVPCRRGNGRCPCCPETTWKPQSHGRFSLNRVGQLGADSLLTRALSPPYSVTCVL